MNRPLFICAVLISAVLCFGALAPMPYNYFRLLRWVVFLTSCWGAYRLRDRFWESVAPFYLSVAVLLNPLLPFHFKRGTWNTIDLCIGVGLLLSLITHRKPKENKIKDEQL